MSDPRESMVTMRIDGRTLRAREGSFVLDVAKEAGIEIPTLCNHPDLEPIGACRVCMVEVTHPDWRGWSGLMTACLYPVKEGIEVSTHSDRVKAARRGVLSLLRARCPNSDTIRILADRYDARADGLTTDPQADSCILCGLCTRVCETYATGAISTVGRGALKRVSTFADNAPEDCVGCGACVSVCPTGEVQGQRSAMDYRIWERSFPTAVCKVDESACIGCGACEESCPFSVPRVALHASGQQVALIPSAFCRGCGACVGACPTGAISQQNISFDDSPPLPGMTHVFACSRSNLPRIGGAQVVKLPCVGSVTVRMMLEAIASRASGVLVVGRHQATCRFEGAEDPVRDRVNSARRLLDLAGLEPDILRFEEPAPGPQGPRDSILAFQKSLSKLPETPRTVAPTDERLRGLDGDLSLWNQLVSDLPDREMGVRFLRESKLPAAREQGTVLLAGSVPALHVLGETLFYPVSLVDALHAALDTLRHLGLENPGVRISSEVTATTFTLEPLAGAQHLDDRIRSHSSWPNPPRMGKVGVNGSQEENALVRILGYEPVNVGPDPLPDRFKFTSQELSSARNRLSAVHEAGTGVLLVSDPRALARWALLTRTGAWRSSLVLPVLGVQLASFCVRGIALGTRTLESTRIADFGAEVAS